MQRDFFRRIQYVVSYYFVNAIEKLQQGAIPKLKAEKISFWSNSISS